MVYTKYDLQGCNLYFNQDIELCDSEQDQLAFPSSSIINAHILK